MMLFLIVLFACCSKAMSMVSVDELTQGISKFSADIYQQCAQSKTGHGNMIISPFSMSMALTFLSQGTNGTTYDELRKGLYLNNNKTIVADQFHELDQLIRQSAGNSELFIANHIFLMQGYELRKDFEEMAVDKFSSGIESINFANAEESAAIVNRFVEEKTQGLIKHFEEAKSLDKSTRFLLINAVYLKCKWQNPFSKNQTQIQFYFNETDFVWVDSLQKRKTKLNVANNLMDLDAQALELAYFNSNLTFLIILPKNRTGLIALENHLKDYDLTKIFDQMSINEINVKIPKFKVETEVNFNEIIKNLGMTAMFDEVRADLSGMINSREKIYIDNIMHKAFIEINEEYTEAAAVSRVRGRSKSNRIFMEFNAEHPFVYYVWDKQNNISILSGHIKTFK